MHIADEMLLSLRKKITGEGPIDVLTTSSLLQGAKHTRHPLRCQSLFEESLWALCCYARIEKCLTEKTPGINCSYTVELESSLIKKGD
jgi:hypothetical protein